MRIESTAFTAEDLARFLDDLADQDRRALVARLERACARLGELGRRVPDDDTVNADGAWTAREVLAHVATLSKFYGVLAYQVGTGALTELDLLGRVSVRDEIGQSLARRPAAELVEMAQADQRRTLEWLRGASPAQLRRRCSTGPDASLTAEEIARLALTAHVEQHLDQLEAAL